MVHPAGPAVSDLFRRRGGAPILHRLRAAANHGGFGRVHRCWRCCGADRGAAQYHPAKMRTPRSTFAALTLSAAGLIAIVSNEGFTDKAVIPIPGDRPTVGFGSTFNADGSPVKMGDTTTPQKALRMSLAHIGKDELRLARCVTGEVSQIERDVLIDFAYWRGSGGACRSDVVQNINAGNYAAACEAYLNLDSRRAAGKDCKDPAKRCRGVWLRAQERHAKCMAAQ